MTESDESAEESPDADGGRAVSPGDDAKRGGKPNARNEPINNNLCFNMEKRTIVNYPKSDTPKTLYTNALQYKNDVLNVR